ncbi:MAG: STAS/SEC14 domain-containing protein [Pseudomonadota bacterium]
MLSVTQTAPNRLNIELEGMIDADDMRTGLEDFIRFADGIAEGKLLYIIPGLAWPTFSALVVEMGMMPQLLRLLGHFDKCAVVTDTGWLRSAAEFEGMFIPGLQIKAFGSENRTEAELWLLPEAEVAEAAE